jgi:hypothetical protein
VRGTRAWERGPGRTHRSPFGIRPLKIFLVIEPGEPDG